MEPKKHSVTVYSTPTCPYCVMAKNYFTKNNVEYVDLDVSRDDRAAHEMIAKSQQMGVPVIDIDGTIVVGYRPDVFAQLLNR